MILLIDNYDSFTWNLWHYLSDLGAEVVTYRNDELTAEEALALKPKAIVISPGPRTPKEAGICLDLVKAIKEVPLLGICLGFQCVGMAFGAKLIRTSPPVHGKLSMINHQGKGLLAGCPKPLVAARYHSLALERKSIPDCFNITAETKEQKLVMAIEHKSLPLYGVLFHPESIATSAGYRLLANFLTLAGIASLNEAKISALEKQILNLHERFPDHIHP